MNKQNQLSFPFYISNFLLQLPQNKFPRRATSCLFTDHKISLNA
jgi:hypothetical protein